MTFTRIKLSIGKRLPYSYLGTAFRRQAERSDDGPRQKAPSDMLNLHMLESMHETIFVESASLMLLSTDRSKHFKPLKLYFRDTTKKLRPN